MVFRSAKISIRLGDSGKHSLIFASVSPDGKATYKSIEPTTKAEVSKKVQEAVDQAIQHQAHQLAQQAAEAAYQAGLQADEYKDLGDVE